MPRRYSMMVALFTGLALSVSAATAASPQNLKLTTQPRAGFEVSPLVHRFQANPGQTLRFKFDLRGREQATTIEIQPVGLTQEVDGQITPSAQAAPPGVRLLTKSRLTLDAGAKSAIEGVITVPADSAMCVFGLLVKDMGLPMAARPQDPAQKTVTVRFVTQYLLRIEVTVVGGRGATVNDLRAISGELIEREGMAIASVRVQNPTATAVPMEARCRLLRKVDDRFVPVGDFFSLGHPSRATAEGATRYEARVLGSSVVRLEATVPEAIFPADYSMEVQLAPPGRNPMSTSRFAIAVPDEAFPGQRTVVARIVDAVQLKPAQLVLSTQRGGNRMATIQFHNSGAEPVTIRITPRPFGDNDITGWVTVRPESFELRPGGKRGAMVTMSKRGEAQGAQYLTLGVEVQPQGRPAGSHDVPVALIVGPTTAPLCSIGAARYDATDHAVIVPIRNMGSTHLALDAHLRMSDAFNRGMDLRAGFGKWLLPGQQDELKFRLMNQHPPAGDYQVRGQLSIGPDSPTQGFAGAIRLDDATQVTQVPTP